MREVFTQAGPGSDLTSNDWQRRKALVSFGFPTVRGSAGATRYFLRCRRSGIFAGCNFHCAGVAAAKTHQRAVHRKTNAPGSNQRLSAGPRQSSTRTQPWTRSCVREYSSNTKAQAEISAAVVARNVPIMESSSIESIPLAVELRLGERGASRLRESKIEAEYPDRNHQGGETRRIEQLDIGRGQLRRHEDIPHSRLPSILATSRDLDDLHVQQDVIDFGRLVA